MDFSKLSQNNWIGVGGGLAVLISGFLPWWTFLGFSNVSGFGSGFFGLFGILFCFAAAVILLLKVTGTSDVKIQNLSAEQIAMVLAGIGALFVILRVLAAPGGFGRGIGAWLGLVGSIATAAGAFLSAKDQGIGIPSADDFGIGGGSGGSDDSGSTTTF